MSDTTKHPYGIHSQGHAGRADVRVWTKRKGRRVAGPRNGTFETSERAGVTDTKRGSTVYNLY
jgi:hypothetical protein